MKIACEKSGIKGPFASEGKFGVGRILQAPVKYTEWNLYCTDRYDSVLLYANLLQYVMKILLMLVLSYFPLGRSSTRAIIGSENADLLS